MKKFSDSDNQQRSELNNGQGGTPSIIRPTTALGYAKDKAISKT
jgi:hypothetical protein